MESQLIQFENDLNKLLFEYDFRMIFRDNEELEISNQNLQIFYSKYRDLVSNILIYDNNKNYYGLYLNDKDRFVIDTFARQKQYDLSPRDKVEKKGNNYLYHYPFFEADKVSGNIIVEVDFNQFAQKIFSFYPRGRTISWKWVVTADGEILSNDFDSPFEVENVNAIADSIDMFATGILKHYLSDTTGASEKVYSSYYPMSIFNKNLGIVFTASKKDFNKYFIQQNLLISILAFLISLGLIIHLITITVKLGKREENHMMIETVFRQIIEKFPVGIIILDSNNTIRNINSKAQHLLFVDRRKDLIGSDFSQQFLLSNKYLLQDNKDANDKSEYLYYEKDGIETVVYRLQEKTRIGGEDLILIGLIDVSAIERARKQEVAANRTKSDFIASMSHEIRTPMNGIIGLVSELLETDLPEKQKEEITLIKKSSDLLLNIINDLLDLSKIEAGKMVLEEIPFNLREELSISIAMFEPLAKEKGLAIETKINTNVPDKLIGDPFRLRQVISNLLSNALKFTSVGKVVIGAEMMEIEQSSLQLLFWVEDTGIGIPKDRINSIFSSYTQTRGSVSRKYGGTGLGTSISKQLVELMNGEIWVESPSGIALSDDNPGSKFSFTVFVYSNEPIEKEFNYREIKKLHQISTLFLTKDPHPGKNSLNKLLINFGINTTTKIYQDSNVDTIIHHIKSKKDLYHLIIISDKNNVDGFALANRLHQEALMRQYPVILVSNSDELGNYKIARKLLIDYYLVEPVESKELYDIINQTFPELEDRNSVLSILNSLPAELKILLAEDNPINQKVAKSIFKYFGYEIDVVHNGKLAVDNVTKKDYDIIFMDLLMPEMDGIDAAKAIREKGMEMPIIAMSANDSDEIKSATILAGMNDYIIKPAKMETIKELLIKLFSTNVK